MNQNGYYYVLFITKLYDTETIMEKMNMWR